MPRGCLANGGCDSGFCDDGQCVEPTKIGDPCKMGHCPGLKCDYPTKRCVANDFKRGSSFNCDTVADCLSDGWYCNKFRQCRIKGFAGSKCAEDEECENSSSCFLGTCRRRCFSNKECFFDKCLEVEGHPYNLCFKKDHEFPVGSGSESIPGPNPVYSPEPNPVYSPEPNPVYSPGPSSRSYPSGRSMRGGASFWPFIMAGCVVAIILILMTILGVVRYKRAKKLRAAQKVQPLQLPQPLQPYVIYPPPGPANSLYQNLPSYPQNPQPFIPNEAPPSYDKVTMNDDHNERNEK